jgi:hypothetical protein
MKPNAPNPRPSTRPHRATGPHRSIKPVDQREEFALELFDALWERYRSRVNYAASYEAVAREAGATFLNDHIAFRTIASQRPSMGITSISRIAEALGYRAAGSYHFADQHLNATHYQHPNTQFPKLFISELLTWELSDQAREVIDRTTSSYRGPLSVDTLVRLGGLTGLAAPGATIPAGLLEQLVAYFTELPWALPEKSDVDDLNVESQYGAWVLVHGFAVNHFTALVNAHGAGPISDIQKTAEALRRAGVPMKAEIEGEPGSALRQTATEAAVVEVAVRQQGRVVLVPWTYAYFELAERGYVADPATGNRVRFEGFLGAQAATLFRITQPRKT